MKSNPGDRKNNVQNQKNNIVRTQNNIEFANEIIAETSNTKIRTELAEDNARREQALDGMKHEFQDEAKDCNKRK